MIHTLRVILDSVQTETSFEKVLQTLVSQLRQALDVDGASLYLLDEGDQCYVLRATDGLNQDAVGNVRLKLNQGLIGVVGTREEPLNLANAAVHPQFHEVHRIGEELFHGFLSVPLIERKKVLGVLVVQRRKAYRFSDSDERFMLTLAAQLAGILVASEARCALETGHGADSKDKTRFFGTSVSAGIAVGPAVMVNQSVPLSAVEERQIEDLEAEIALFQSVCDTVSQDIEEIKHKVGSQLDAKDLGLFDVYQSVLNDDAFVGEVFRGIARGYWAATALKNVMESTLARFEALEDDFFRERAVDIQAVGDRLLGKLLGQHAGRVTDEQEPVILVGDDVSAASILEWPREQLAGVISRKGTGNSHLAIVARAIELPAIVGVRDLPLGSLQGQRIILDGLKGRVIVNPSEQLQNSYQIFLKQEQIVSDGIGAEFDQPAKTGCGQNITILANTGFVADARVALSRGAQGVGLMRTEISFMGFGAFPSEEEQRQIYRQHLECCAPYPVSMRTLDIGGDKSLPYFPIRETNPFLGWRGIRVTLDHPEILIVQVRAMLKASEGLGNLRILLPMVSCVEEIDEALRLIHRALKETFEEGYNVMMPLVGVMLEVPAALIMAKTFADRIDFFSVGTNDLIQYLLAVDRNNAKVADLCDGFHPAVLQCLSDLVVSLRDFNLELSVCGEIAGDPVLAALLVGMGYRCLSMSPSCLLKVKWVLRRLTMADMEMIVDGCRRLTTAERCRQFSYEQLRLLGIGEVVRQDNSLVANF